MRQEYGSGTDTLAEPTIDIGTAVYALAFNAVALPPNLPEAIRQRIEESAAREREALGPADALAFETRGRREEDERKKDSDRKMEVLEEVERQREEWARTSHSFGSVTRTGAEWQELSQDLRSGELRNWLLVQIMADGHSRADAERIADKARDIAGIIATPESLRTPEQRRDMAEADRDPQLRRYLDMADRHSREMHGPDIARNEAAASTDTMASLDARTGAIADFPNAPNLAAEFLAAQAPAEATNAPSRSTAPTPQRVLATGFDV